jgi:hypothetical protein
MSGETELPLNERISQIEASLDTYEKEVGLPPVTINESRINSITDFITNISVDKLRKLTAEESGEMAVLLAQMIFDVQRYYNKEYARFVWAESELDHFCGVNARTIAGKFLTFDERKNILIKSSSYASNLFSIKKGCKARMNRISYLPTRIEFIAKTLLDLQQTKRRNSHG